ncbi:hypothetical protein [Brachybacterium sp. FME24]|uniref:hypothetical protein n=1 Tax=Brachybacterium sp. FME24 TaxID=2742605 RepID=UPI00186865CF|nr:hypothetical protein [Brachybacterium sp. FME24]
MFGRAAQQRKQIELLEARVRRLDGLVDRLAARGGVDEEELLELRGQAGSDIPEPCRSLVAEGRYIEAIKVYREFTGAGLKEAKDAIDRFRDRGI